MAYAPVQLLSTPLETYAGYWLKFYTQGTTTPLSMATDATGGTLIIKAEISSGGTVPAGFIKTSGDALLNPHLNAAYDAWLFPTAAEADANDTALAIQLADNITADPASTIPGYTVADKTAAVLITPVAGKTLFVEDTDGGLFKAVTGAAALTYSDNGGAYCGTQFIPTGGDGSSAWVRVDTVVITPIMFGAAADGIVDDYLALKAWIDYCIANSRRGYIPGGTYLTGTRIIINGAFIATGDGDGKDQAGTVVYRGATTIVGTDAAGCILIKSDTASNYLYGIDLKNISIDCLDSGAIGIQASSISQCNFDRINIARCTSDGFLIDDGNGAGSFFNNIGAYSYNAGANALSANSNGLRLYSDTGVNGVVQTTVGHTNMFVEDGDGLVLAGCDNNAIDFHYTFANGTGRSVVFSNSGAISTRNNVIKFLGGGKVVAESTSFANRITHATSESCVITVDSGAQLHYQLVDYDTAELFSTHIYKMSDEYHVNSSDMLPDGTVATTMFFSGNLWPCINFPESASGFAGISIPAIYTFNDGDIIAVSLVYSTDGATGGNAVFRIRSMSPPILGDTTTPTTDQNLVVSVNTTPLVINRVKTTLSSVFPITRNDSILLRIDRLPADALDTHTNNIKLIGLILHYESDGPNSGGSGPFDIPPPIK